MPSTPERRLIGPHLPLGAGLLKAADRARQIGATAVQVFTDNPTAWRRRTEPPKTLAAFRARLAEAGIGPIAVHAPYLINLCGPNEDFWHKSIATVANELRVGAQYGASFVVMHIGSHRGLERAEGIRRLVEGMRRALDETSEPAGQAQAGAVPMLVLENAPGSGDGIGSTVEDLADIIAAAAAAGLPMERVGVCLDTAHLWAAGYEIATEKGVSSLVGRLDELMGRDRVVMLHLNDSKTAVGSHLDRHEHIGAGQLGQVGMSELLHHPWLATLPTYLETPGMDTGYDGVNLERVRLVLAGEKLPSSHQKRLLRADRVPGRALQSINPVVRGRPYERPISKQQGRTGILHLSLIERPNRWATDVTRPTGERTDPMSVQNGLAFNEWLRTQLKAKKMSQRQLAQQSGVDHSTISRLVRGDRTPSLGTATKLARGLRELRDETETPHYFGLIQSSTSHPIARVEYALRSDDLISEPQVRQVMEYYLVLRMRRLAAARQSGPEVRPIGTDGRASLAARVTTTRN